MSKVFDCENTERLEPGQATGAPSATALPIYYEHARPDVLDIVPTNARRVLELGCATGRLGAAIKRRQDCHVTGIEYAAEPAERARMHLDRVIVGDCENLELDVLFQSGEFDCLIAADVLEHLRDPEDLLQRLQPFLTSDVSIVVSIPNVRHAGVIQAAVEGYWTYQKDGILDRTHLRFFTRREINSMFDRIGFAVEEWRAVVDPTRAEWERVGRPTSPAFGPLTVTGLSENEIREFFVIQWLARARSSIRSSSTAQYAVAEDNSGAVYIETIGWDMEGLIPRMTVAQSEIQELTEERARLAQANQDLWSDYASLNADNEAALNRLAQLEIQHAAEKAQLQADVARLREQYDQLTASTSWRLTRPLRELAWGRTVLVAPARSLVHNYPTARRAARRFAQVLWWTVTLQLPGRIARRMRVSHPQPSRDSQLGSHTESHGALAEADSAHAAEIVSLVRMAVPADAVLLVATSGEEKLLQLCGRATRHFPQAESGAYAGHNPPDSTAAIAHLEALRLNGAGFLLLPSSALEWLDCHASFRQHVSRQYRLLASLRDGGLLFSLRDSPDPHAAPGAVVFEALALLDSTSDDGFAILDWNTGLDLDLANNFPQHTIFAPPDRAHVLPYLDHSVDVVVVRDPGRNAAEEARRVARDAVITLTDRSGQVGAVVDAQIEWMPDSSLSQLPSASIIVTVSPEETLAQSRIATMFEFLPTGFRGEMLIAANRVSNRSREALSQIQRGNASVRVLNVTVQEATLLAEGDVLIFVGEDAIPLPDSVPMLLRSLGRFADAAVVGGRVVGWDGHLCEAGGVVSDDGKLQVLGAGSIAPDDPAYGFMREVDWCSRSLLATWRKVFEQGAGFDLNYRSSRFQAADYCLRVRQDGHRVYYQPASVVIRLGQGPVPKTERSDGHLFADRWSRARSVRPAP